MNYNQIDYSPNLVSSGLLNSSFSKAIKSRTGVDLIARTAVFYPTVSYYTAKTTVLSTYSKYEIKKYTFDVIKKCLFNSQKVLAKDAYVIVPESVTTYITKHVP
jgi:hypothetical protein